MDQSPKQNYLDEDDRLQSVNNPLAVTQPGERMICEIRRHPFGLFGVYAVTVFVCALALSFAIFIPYFTDFLTDQQKIGVVLISALVILVTVMIGLIGVYIYKNNRWVVTSDSITQISQTGLFNTHSSQLSLANLGDVSVSQDGIIQQLMGFGELVVESAGEKSKFIFNFCPTPNEYARKIIAAHEEYISVHPTEMVVGNRPLTVTHSYNQPPSA